MERKKQIDANVVKINTWFQIDHESVKRNINKFVRYSYKQEQQQKYKADKMKYIVLPRILYDIETYSRNCM